LLEIVGIHAHAVLGHSLGEIAAVVFQFRSWFAVRGGRADLAHPGGMAAVAASEEKVARNISKLDLNSRTQVVKCQKGITKY